MVFSGLVTAWRFATWPTRRSPLFVKPTTDGVVRPPSWLGMTTGSLFVTTAVLLVCTAHWLDCFHGRTEPPDGHVGLWAAMTEGLFVVAMLLVLVASYALKGIVPM